MHLDLADQEADYVYRLLYTTRPMSEVETIVGKMRQQAAAAQAPRMPPPLDMPAEGPSAPPGRGNGADDAEGLPGLP